MRVKATVSTSMAIEVADALMERAALVQMYQVGFLDGWLKANNMVINNGARAAVKREHKILERIKPDIEKRFEWRFMRKMGRNIKRVRGLND